ncbi:MAG: hypothetical protein JWN39_2667 [Ilumatobacteraceae bacterium]|nr:hypothetical protein [Ilumatobacteraceae bacterium]
MTFARDLWLRIETIHAVTYFGEETATAGKVLGLDGFWMAYFGFRAAPLGRVGAGAVEATFSNFAPSFVQRWVPAVWELSTPEACLEARLDAAVATLTRLYPDVARVAASVSPILEGAIDRGAGAGRPLFAANRLLARSHDPARRLWQLCTCLREHRGDGHVAALTAAGIDGLEAHVLIAIEQDNSPIDLQRTRGWTAEDWDAAVERLKSRRLIAGDGGLTEAGRTLRSEVEARTDVLAGQPFLALSGAERDQLVGALVPLARAVSGSGVIRYPNPMGLPRLG